MDSRISHVGRKLLPVAAVATAAVAPAVAAAQTVNWTNWISMTPGTPGSAAGTITIGSTPVTVTYSGEVQLGSQTSAGGTNWFVPSSTYTSATVGNAPDNPGYIRLSGGNTLTNTLTFSSPVSNLFFAVVSLGAGGNTVTYNFSSPFTILSQGTDPWGGCNTCLQQSGQSLSGTEGSGTLQFSGPISSLIDLCFGKGTCHSVSCA